MFIFSVYSVSICSALETDDRKKLDMNPMLMLAVPACSYYTPWRSRWQTRLCGISVRVSKIK